MPNYAKFLLLSVLLTVAIQHELKAQMPPAPVVTTTVKRQSLSTTVELVSTLRPVRRTQLAAETSGLVRELLVREGHAVAAGAVVARFARDLSTKALKVQEAELGVAESELALVAAGTRQEEIDRLAAMERETNRVQVRMKERLEHLRSRLSSGAATEDEVADAAMNHDLAREQLAQAQANLLRARNGARREEIAMAQARVGTARSKLELLKIEDEKRDVSTPFESLVSALYVEIGQWVERGSPIVELIDITSLEVVAPLPQRIRPYVQTGHPVRVVVESLGTDGIIESTIDRLSSQADEKARTFGAFIKLANTNGRLLAGLSATVLVSVGTRADVRVIPADAVYSAQGREYVCVVDNGVIRHEPVQLGLRVEGMVEIVSELPENTRVVIRGNERLFPGQPVIDTSASTTAESRK